MAVRSTTTKCAANANWLAIAEQKMAERRSSSSVRITLSGSVLLILNGTQARASASRPFAPLAGDDHRTTRSQRAGTLGESPEHRHRGRKLETRVSRMLLTISGPHR